MKKKHKITLLVIGIFLVLSLMLSSSYALWVFNVSQESTNVLVSDCFEITLTDNNPIGLSASFPMRDSDGVQTTPYTFTIRNICNHPADFQINLETLSSSTIDEEFIKADLNGHITEYNAAESLEPTIDGARSAAMLYEDTLAVNGKKTYNLRLWINENATQEDVENKSYSSKVSVKATVRKQYAEGTLVDGMSFNETLKQLADGGEPRYFTENTSITSIEWSDNAPQESDNAVNIAKTGTATPIYAWFNDGVIYINSKLDKIYTGSHSLYLFYNLKNVTTINLDHFDTSKAENMSMMFYGTNNLINLNLSHFDTSNVTDMSYMFSGTSKLTNLDLSHFDTSKVTSMSSMFQGMNSLTSLDISHFDTSKVTNMSDMFNGVKSLTSLNLNHFDTSNVTSMYNMFRDMSNLTSIDVSNFDTSKVTNMSDMFYGVKSLTSLNLNHFDTSNVTDMSYMFNIMNNLTSLDISNFDTSKVTSMMYMFHGMSNLTSLDISNFDTSNVLNMGGLFYGLSSLVNLDISNFDTSNVTSMSQMFLGMSSLTELDISNFDTSNVTYMSSMFYGMNNLKTIYIGTNWSTSSVTSSSTMFYRDNSLIGGSGTTYDDDHIDKEYACVDDHENGKPGYFTLKTS